MIDLKPLALSICSILSLTSENIELLYQIIIGTLTVAYYIKKFFFDKPS